jgi:hypothetical protein
MEKDQPPKRLDVGHAKLATSIFAAGYFQISVLGVRPLTRLLTSQQSSGLVGTLQEAREIYGMAHARDAFTDSGSRAQSRPAGSLTSSEISDGSKRSLAAQARPSDSCLHLPQWLVYIWKTMSRE